MQISKHKDVYEWCDFERTVNNRLTTCIKFTRITFTYKTVFGYIKITTSVESDWLSYFLFLSCFLSSSSL